MSDNMDQRGAQVEIFSPAGGRCEADAMSDPEDASQWEAEDVISRGYMHNPEFMIVEDTRPVHHIDVDRFDGLLVAGGRGPMFSFEQADNCTASSSSSTRPAEWSPPSATAWPCCATPPCPTGSRWSAARL